MNSLNEVRIVVSLKSSLVVSYKEALFDENESCLGIVMEYADKGDVYKKICEFKKAVVFLKKATYGEYSFRFYRIKISSRFKNFTQRSQGKFSN